MRIQENEWRKTKFPFLWRRTIGVWAGEDRDGEGGYLFDTCEEYRFSVGNPNAS